MKTRPVTLLNHPNRPAVKLLEPATTSQENLKAKSLQFLITRLNLSPAAAKTVLGLK